MEPILFKNQIKQFLIGKLSKNEEISLLEWVKQSPDNVKSFLSIQQSLDEKLESSNDIFIMNQWKNLLNRIDPGRRDNNRLINRFNKYFRLSVPMAAAFFIGFIAAALLLWEMSQLDIPPATNQKITAPFGARTSFFLPDSSEVWLNSGSEILFSANFTEKRVVHVSGEAFFNIRKGNNPFLVSTVYGEVEAKGTSFNVKAYPGDLFETTLIEGSVHIEADKGHEVDLIPGSHAIYTHNGFSVTPVDTKIYTSWTEGRLIFRKEYLPQMAKRLERWYNIKIELDNDKRLKDIHYTCSIEMESFSEVLNLLKVTASVDYTWDDKARIIKLFYKK